jgi:tripartite ATP-independent transporter DctM subunit
MSVVTGLVGIAVLLALLLLRVPIALAMIAVSLVGVSSMVGPDAAMALLGSAPYDFTASWTLSAVPMFLLMGFVSYHAGLTGGLFAAANSVLCRIPGGLAVSSILACSGFAAICGSSVACAASMGRIAIPEMIRAGYKPSFACGAIAAGGTIGALIPPSILLILFGVVAQASVNALFIAGMVVGLATAASYILVIWLTCLLEPSVIPPRIPPRADEGTGQPSARKALLDIWPILVLVVIIFGGMFSGLFTATEAGAVGSLGVLVLSALIGRLDRKVVGASLRETLSTTAGLFIIAVGAAMFTRFLGLSGLSMLITDFVGGITSSTTVLLLAIVMIYLLLGMFMEPFGAMLVTLPIFLPIIQAQDLSPIWFGVFVVKLLEVGMITPPVGMNVFVIKSVVGEQLGLGAIFRGVVPFFLADMFVIGLLIAAPGIVTAWL